MTKLKCKCGKEINPPPTVNCKHENVRIKGCPGCISHHKDNTPLTEACYK